MDPNNPFVMGLVAQSEIKKSHVTTSVRMSWLNLTEIS